MGKDANRIKEQVAKDYGFENMFGGRWKYAMMILHRRKKQIELYEEVIKRLEDSE